MPSLHSSPVEDAEAVSIAVFNVLEIDAMLREDLRHGEQVLVWERSKKRALAEDDGVQEPIELEAFTF